MLCFGAYVHITVTTREKIKSAFIDKQRRLKGFEAVAVAVLLHQE